MAAKQEIIFSAKDLASGKIIKVAASMDAMRRATRTAAASMSGINSSTRTTAANLSSLGLAYKTPIVAASRFAIATQKVKRSLKAAGVATLSFGKKLFGAGGIIRKVTGKVFNLKTALIGLAGIFVAKRLAGNLIATSQSFEDLRTQLDALQGSSEGGRVALEWVKDFAETTPQSLEEVTRAFVLARAFGLEPMDGTMQSLVDINAKLGGKMEKLISITRGVGQMFTKGRIAAQEMNLQLTEQGVPAWELLAKAMNRSNDTTKFTVANLQVMASKGELGKDAIKLLIEEMGRFGEGAALAKMKDFTGLWSNFNDQVSQSKDSFARAKGGLFDFVKAGLDIGIEKLQKFRKDGSLAKWGQDLGFTFINATKKILIGTSVIVGAISPIFNATVNGMNSILTVFNSLPPWMKTLGVVGAVLLGAKGVLGISLALGALLEFEKVLGRVAAKTEKAKKPRLKSGSGLFGGFGRSQIEDSRNPQPPSISEIEDILEQRTGTRPELKPGSGQQGPIAALLADIERANSAAGDLNIKLLEISKDKGNPVSGIAEAISALDEKLKGLVRGREQEDLGRKILAEAQAALPKGDGGSIDDFAPTLFDRPLGPEEDVEGQKATQLAFIGELEKESRRKRGEAEIEEATAMQELAERRRQVEIESFDLTEVIEHRRAQLEEIRVFEVAGVEQTSVAALKKFEIEQKLANDIKALEEQKSAARKQNFQTAINLSNALFIFGGQKSKAMFKITKALNLAETVTSTWTAATKALAAPPGPPATIPMAAAVAAMGLANVARISATSFGGGAAGGGGGGGGVPLIGASPSGANLSGRLDANQQGVKIDLTVNALDAKSFEGFDWEPSMEKLSEALGNYITSGGGLGTLNVDVLERS